MKPVFLSLFSLLFILHLSAQDKQSDSIAAEITSLEMKKAELSSKAEKLRQQMNEKFTIQQSIRNKIEELELQLKDDRTEMERLEKKTELTSMEKKRLKTWTDNQKELKKCTKSLGEMDAHSDKSLELLTNVGRMQTEIDDRLKELKGTGTK
jgi:predicted RNase H-like nuclease (RuvC/YqgF family)